MPIVVEHQPSALGIGAVAFQGGLGQYRLKREQLDLQKQEQMMRWAQMALQNQAQLRNDALQAQSMQDANARFLLDRQQQAGQFAAQQGEQMRQFDVGQGNQNAWRDAQVQMQKDQFENQGKLQQASFDYRTAADATNFEQQQALEAARAKQRVDDFMAMERGRLTIEGQKIQEDLQRQLGRIQAAVADGRMTEGEAKRMETNMRDRAVGMNFNALAIQSKETPEARQAAAQADVDSRTVILNGNPYVLEEGKLKPVEPKSDPVATQEGRNMTALHKMWVDEKKAHDESNFNKSLMAQQGGGQFVPTEFMDFETYREMFGPTRFPVQAQKSQMRAKNMGQFPQPGEGEPPPQDPVQQLGQAALQANQGAPPEIQQDIQLLAQIAAQFPPGTEANMPPELVQAENDARMRIMTWKARANQPGIGNGAQGQVPMPPVPPSFLPPQGLPGAFPQMQ